jgi:hypothetical protein
MNHSFDVDIAVKYGVNAAILLNNIYWWIRKNKANNRHYHDGCYWTYNSRTAFTELFPYLSERQIKTAMDKLIADGVVKTGDYNTDKWKRPTWYALTKKGWALLQNGSIDDTKMSDRDSEDVPSYTDINTESKTDTSISCKSAAKENPAGFDDFWSVYPRHLDKKSALRAWTKLKPSDELKQIIIADIRRRVNSDKEWTEEKYIPYPASYLNGERWEDEPAAAATDDDEYRPTIQEMLNRKFMENGYNCYAPGYDD